MSGKSLEWAIGKWVSYTIGECERDTPASDISLYEVNTELVCCTSGCNHDNKFFSLRTEKAQGEYDGFLDKSTTDKKLQEAAWDLEDHRYLYNEAQKIA